MMPVLERVKSWRIQADRIRMSNDSEDRCRRIEEDAVSELFRTAFIDQSAEGTKLILFRPAFDCKTFRQMQSCYIRSCNIRPGSCDFQHIARAILRADSVCGEERTDRQYNRENTA